MIKETEVDGVPTFLAPTDGPLRAGLVFRVGQADETLATHGITHLVEHLALHRLGLADYHYNGATGLISTHFFMQGGEAEVVGFLAGVCESLGDLPVDRLVTEREIIRTEAAGRDSDTAPKMPLWRYGTVGYGLASAREWGMYRLTAEDVRGWARRWFTRDNAALWLAGDGVPAGLRLALPGGKRRPVPKAVSTLPRTPAYFIEGPLGLVVDSVVPAGLAAQAYTGVLERELTRALRHENGYSATVLARYAGRGDGYATVTAAADALAENQGAALGTLVDALARLRLGQIRDEDLAAVRTALASELADPRLAAQRLPDWATNALIRQPNLSVEELLAQQEAVTAQSVSEVAVAAAQTALLRLPEGYTAEWAGFVAAPAFSATAVDGDEVLSFEEQDSLLVVGADGVSMLTPAGPLTVRYADCRAQLRRPDGALTFIGTDGIRVPVEPTLWQLTPAQLTLLDTGAPEPVRVPLPAREPAEIPQPDSKALRTKKSRAPIVFREPQTEQPPEVETLMWDRTKTERKERSQATPKPVADRRSKARRSMRRRGFATLALVSITVRSIGWGLLYASMFAAVCTLASAVLFMVKYDAYKNSR